MVKLYSKTMDDLEKEMLTDEVVAKLGRETILSCLIGLEHGMSEVELDVETEEELGVQLLMSVQTADWQEVFKANMQALIDTEEYQLASLCSQMLEEGILQVDSNLDQLLN